MKMQEIRRPLALVGWLTRGQRQELADKLRTQSTGGVHRSAGVGWEPSPGMPALRERVVRGQRHGRRVATLQAPNLQQDLQRPDRHAAGQAASQGQVAGTNASLGPWTHRSPSGRVHGSRAERSVSLVPPVPGRVAWRQAREPVGRSRDRGRISWSRTGAAWSTSARRQAWALVSADSVADGARSLGRDHRLRPHRQPQGGSHGNAQAAATYRRRRLLRWRRHHQQRRQGTWPGAQRRLGTSRRYAVGAWHIQNVDAYYSRVKTWVRRLHGMATHYFENYFSRCGALDRMPRNAAQPAQLPALAPGR